MTDFIKVKAVDNSGRVALWEKDAAHPNQEVFVAGDAVVEVANTAAVRAAIKAGALVEVQPEVAKAPVKQAVSIEVKPIDTGLDAPTISAAIRQEGPKTTKR